MEKYLVLYYSKTGNSKFLAQKVAQALACDIKRITTPINATGLLFIASLFKIKVGINISKKELANYKEVIIFGPVWGGALISPLRTAIKKCSKANNTIHFAVSCETKEEEKGSRYGFERVLQAAREAGNEQVKTTAAFSTSLVDDKKDPEEKSILQKIKLTESNFEGPIKTRLDAFVDAIKQAK